MSRIDFGKFVKNRLASLVSFDNAGTDLVGSTTVQAAIVALAARHFGKNLTFNNTAGNSSVTGSTIINLATISPTGLPSGTYLVFGWSSVLKSLISGQIETWLEINGTEYVRREVSMDDDDYYYGDFTGHIISLSGSPTIQYRGQKVNGGGNFQAKDRYVVLWRLF